jgi:hypothetical protein
MRLGRSSLAVLGISAVFAAIGWACFHREATAESTLGVVAPTTAWILATPHDENATATQVRRVELRGDGVRATTVATIPHPPGAVVRGDVRDGLVAVVADDALARDPDWGSTLWSVDASGARARLDGVGHATRPLVGHGGVVFVERGTRGPAPDESAARAGHLREDPISIAAVAPDGTARSVYSATAYALHLCGESDGELVVYRVRFGGADLLGIDETTGASRVIAAVPPYARDFTIARGAIVLSNRDPVDAHRWVAVQIDLATGTPRELAAAVDDAPAPFALTGKGFAWSAPGRRGLAFGGGATGDVAPLGAGFDATQAESAGGDWLLVAHVPGSGWDETIALHRATSRVLRLTTNDERIDAIGFGEGTVVR